MRASRSTAEPSARFPDVAHTSGMLVHAVPAWAWVFPPLFSAPWIVACIWLWLRRPRDGEIPKSAADLARERLWLS